MAKEAKRCILEQNRTWNGQHMLGAKGMDEIEDLKMLGFLIKRGILVKEGFLLEVGKLSQGFLFWFNLS